MALRKCFGTRVVKQWVLLAISAAWRLIFAPRNQAECREFFLYSAAVIKQNDSQLLEDLWTSLTSLDSRYLSTKRKMVNQGHGGELFRFLRTSYSYAGM